MMDHLTIDDNGTILTFLDNGAPDKVQSYLTIIAVHGTGFQSAIFRRVQAVASSCNVRFVAVNRRGYGGSTPVPDEESQRVPGGTGEEKAAFHEARGTELAKFVNLFIQQNHLPPISPDGKHGGVALLGWSSGSGLTLAAIATMNKLSEGEKSRLGAYVRAHIILDPSTLALGLPHSPKLWNPHMDSTIPVELQGPFHTRWITSYFDHSDLSSRDANTLSYIVPSESRAPTIYSMTAQDIADIIEDGPIDEGKILFASQNQNYTIYRKACFDLSIRELLPKMKVSVLAGGRTCATALNAVFAIQEDDENFGSNINFHIILGVNHFAQWDDPEKTFKVLMNAANL